jgi:hypothetical protein
MNKTLIIQNQVKNQVNIKQKKYLYNKNTTDNKIIFHHFLLHKFNMKNIKNLKNKISLIN